MHIRGVQEVTLQLAPSLTPTSRGLSIGRLWRKVPTKGPFYTSNAIKHSVFRYEFKPD